MPRVRIDGGLIGVTNNPTSGSAGGMWSFSEHSKYTRSASWPAASAPPGSVNAIVAMIGGGGGSTGGTSAVNYGAGGAGGVLRYANSNIITGNPSLSYTITIGAGGTGILGSTPGSGSNSTFSASAVIATGGGGVPSTSFAGANNADFSGAAGTGSTGSGGGAGAAANGSGNNGGAGANIAISGTFTSYGGGGAGVNASTGGGIGGAGGGGAGQGSSGVSATSGTAGTGGGAGGGPSNATPANGGSGVVIINYPAPQQFTGGTITNVNNLAGSNIVHTFTSSGSLNALATPIDTYFPQTTLLLHGDGTVGANNTAFFDNSVNTFIPFSGTYSNYFQSTSDHLLVSSSPIPLSGQFTVEAWVYTSTSGTQTLYSQYLNSDSTRTVFSIDNNTGYKLKVQNGSNIYWGTTVVPLNQWNHVAFTRDASNTLRFFLNGVLDANTTMAGNVYQGYPKIGNASTAPTIYPWLGYISNFRISNTALYTASFTPQSSVFTANTNTTLLTCQSPVFIDNSINNYTLTANGTPKISSGSDIFITTNGKPLQGTNSPFSLNGWSNYFDGTGDYLSVGNNSNLAIGTNDFTFEFWINFTTVPTGEVEIYESQTSGSFVVYKKSTSGPLTFRSYAGTDYTIQTHANISAGVWYHVAISRTSGTTSAYFNGVQTFSQALATNYTAPTAAYTIGGRNAGTNVITGYISNMRLVVGTGLYSGSFINIPTSPLTAISGTQLLTCQDNKFIDNSLNAFTVTRNNDVAVQPFSPFSPSSAYSNTVVGGSAYFNGSSDYLTHPGTDFAFGTGDFTIEAWVYPVATPGVNYFVWGYRSGNDTSPYLYWSASSGLTFGGDTTNFLTYATGLTKNVWQHIAVTRSGTSLKMYLNGTEVASATNSTNFSDTNTKYIGVAGSSLNYYFNGYISNLRILKGTAQYTANFTPPTAPLTAISNTSLLLNATNAGIIDHTAKNTLTTYGSAAISSTQSKFGNTSMYFNGSTDYLTAAANPHFNMGTGDFTIECWINIPSQPSPTRGDTNKTVTIVDLGVQGSTSGTECSFAIAGSSTNVGTAFEIYNPTGYNVTSASFPSALSLNTWYHIAFVRYGNTVTGYLNGVGYAFSTSASGITFGGNNIAKIGGAWGSAPNNYLNQFLGYIDDLRISKYARYTTNFTPPTSTFLDR